MDQNVGIGIDLGGTFIKYALGFRQGKILKEKKIPTDSQATNSAILGQLSEAVREMAEFARNNGYIPSVVGIGSPGCVDVERGFLKGSTPNFRFWSEVHVGKEIESSVNIPTFIDNDANLMALAEARYGAGVGHKNIICLTIGTGIGGGIIVNGEIYRGSHFAGAELGHMSIKYNGLKCRCGGRGCLERYTSATAMTDYFIKKSAKEGVPITKKNISVKDIFKQFRNGNHLALETIERSTYYLGRGIANFMNIFDPTLVIVGGGVSESGNEYLKRVKTVAFRYAMKNASDNVKIVKAKLGNRAGYMGALSFAFDQLMRNSKS
jgi:glucokinase